MSDNNPLTLSLVTDKDEPNYHWFDTDAYGWWDNSGTLSSVPYFEAVPGLLDDLLRNSSDREQLRLPLGGRYDCETKNRIRDCTEACSNPSFLFTPTNIRVCTALASVALLVQNGTYSIDRSDAQAVQTMDSFHIPDLSTYNATRVFAYVAECIPESCATPRLGECTDDLRRLAQVPIQADSLRNITSTLSQYCDKTNLQLSADIAGPGVSFGLPRQWTGWCGVNANQWRR
jgi:hypothetical protein